MKKTINKSQAHEVSALASCKTITEVLSVLKASAPCLTYKGYTVSYPDLCDMLWQGLKAVEKFAHITSEGEQTKQIYTFRIYLMVTRMYDAMDSNWGKEFHLALADSIGLPTLKDTISNNVQVKIKNMPVDCIKINGVKFAHRELSVYLELAARYLAMEASTTDRGEFRKSMLFIEAVQALFLSCIFAGLSSYDAETKVIRSFINIDPVAVHNLIEQLETKDKYTVAVK